MAGRHDAWVREGHPEPGDCAAPDAHSCSTPSLRARCPARVLARVGGSARPRLLVVVMLVALALCAPLARASALSPGATGAPGVLAEGLSRSLGPLSVSSAGVGDAGVRLHKSLPGISLRASKTSPYWACPEGLCEEIIDPPAHSIAPRRVKGGALARFALPAGGPLQARPLEGDGEHGGYDPQNLQSAYKIPTTGGADQTVALIDAEGYPEAEKDLAVYRERYGLPACTHANGCFRKVNAKGVEGDYPGPNQEWESESALDIEMVSAACPECHILLVESSGAVSGLAEGDETAARLGASEISNSWGSNEESCGADLCEQEAAEFDHPGVFITVAAGDWRYDNALRGGHSPDFPASLPDVVAVGGTSLTRAENARGWSEEAWVDTGSGCSRFPKPQWQADPACAGRMDDDVAAVAACETPVSSYEPRGWADVCGTSVASPLLAGIEAHASEYARSLPGAEAFYNDPSGVFDITKGSNGKCTPPKEDAYFCNAQVGYDGPTGNGSPDGPLPLNGTGPPIATSLPASAVSTSSATLNGVAEPNGLPASYRFEYGRTISYGASVPVPEGSLGTSGQRVSQTITGLSPQSVYHYRLVATSSAGTSYGEDELFTAGVPTVTSVTPDAGSEAGGTKVTITGTNFTGASAVRFGTGDAESFTVESESSISALSPEGNGPVDVTVSSAAGTSATSPGDRFSYDKPGAVLAWGYDHGLLGEHGGVDGSVPAEVSGLPEAVSLAAGDSTNLAVLRNGRVMGWGNNEFGTLGNGTYGPQSVPVGVCAVGVKECPDGPYLEEASEVAAGGVQSLALLTNGTVVAWGDGTGGALGSNTAHSPVPVPVCVTLETPCKPENHLKEVKAIAAGVLFSMALLSNGTVMAWGENYAGQLGDGSSHGPEKCEAGATACSRIPTPVRGLTHVTAIAAGWANALALLEDGSVMAWGENTFGELGDASTRESNKPTPVCAVGAGEDPCSSHLGDTEAIAAGASNGLALLKNGTVAAWGNNGFGELGDDTPYGPSTCTEVIERDSTEKEPCSLVPVIVNNLREVSAIASDAVDRSVLAQLQSGELVSWGANAGGQLGHDSTASSETPLGVCQPYAQEGCPNGPYLAGAVSAMAAGISDLVSFASSPGPVITDVQPDSGPTGGGTSVRIIGAGFTGATAVDFGGVEAGEVRVESPDEIQALTPPGSGTVDVTVSTPEGVSPASAADRFTYQGAPVVVTGIASAYGHSTAELSATVDPLDTTLTGCRFEYGTTPGYGSSVPCSALPGAGSTPVEVTAALTGLEPGTNYHYRAVATNELAAGYGSEQSFSTLPDLPGLPGIGRCVKRTGKARSRYTDAACTAPSAGEDRGKYEWEGWPLAKKGFTAHPAGFFDTPAGAKGVWPVSCAEGAMTGEYTGAQSASLSFTFKDCTVFASEEKNDYCQSAGATSGEIRTAVLVGELGFIDSETREGNPIASVGWLVHAATGETVASFSCAQGGTRTVTGSAVGSIGPPDEMSTSAALRFEQASGHQIPEGFEGELPSSMTISGEAGEEPFGFGSDGAVSVTNEEAIEIRALP